MTQTSGLHGRQRLTIAIFAPENDDLAARFVDSNRQNSTLLFKHIKKSTHVNLTARTQSMGDLEVEVRIGDTNDVVAGFLNRGIDPSFDFHATSFTWNECVASVWSALAIFPGPVLNRPNRFSLLPPIDIPRSLPLSRHHNAVTALDKATVVIAGSHLFDASDGEPVDLPTGTISGWLKFLVNRGVLATISFYPLETGQVLAESNTAPAFRDLGQAGDLSVEAVKQWFHSKL